MKELPVFLDKNYITRKVAEKECRFYKISIGTLFELRKFATCLSQAIVTFIDTWNSTRTDSTTVERTVQSGQFQEIEDGKLIPLLDKELQMLAIDPKLAEIRAAQKQKAVASVIEAFASPENKVALGKIIRDCLRDEYDSEMPPEKVIDSIPAEVFPAVIIGVADANKGVLGPLAGIFQVQMNSILEKTKTKMTPNSSDSEKTGSEEKAPPEPVAVPAREPAPVNDPQPAA